MFRLYAAEAIYDIKRESFPDGTLHMSVPAGDIRSIEWFYEDDAELFMLICIKRHLDASPYQRSKVRLALPYIPHARMDRVKEENDVFTLKYFAEIINSLNFHTVDVVDAHSNVSLALIDRVNPIDVAPYIMSAINHCVYDITGGVGHNDRMRAYDNFMLFFPDEGAMKRYSEHSPVEFAFGMKKRDWKTGKILGLNVINGDKVRDKNILIVDDICSRGGTFYHSAKALKELGAKNIYLYVSHAENTMVEGEMYNTPGLVERIYTLETIFNKENDTLNKVEVLLL